MHIYLTALSAALLAAVLFTPQHSYGQDGAAPAGDAKEETAKEDTAKEDTKKDGEDEAPEVPVEKEPVASAAVKAFRAEKEKWDSKVAALAELREKVFKALPSRRESTLDAYKKAVSEINSMLPELKKATLLAYKDSTNTHADVQRAMLGLLANAIRENRFVEADNLVTLLQDADTGNMAMLAGLSPMFAKDPKSTEEFLWREQAQPADLVKTCVDEIKLRAKEAKTDDLPRVKMTIRGKGDVVIELYENEAPGATGNFISLVQEKFYDGLSFHRVIEGFMAQGGDPLGNGTGGPGYQIKCECHKPEYRRHFRGVLSMAHSGRDTGGSQFFITFARPSHLDGRHTAFGRVIEGMDVVDSITRRDPTRPSQPPADVIDKVEVLRKRDHKYEPNKVTATPDSGDEEGDDKPAGEKASDDKTGEKTDDEGADKEKPEEEPAKPAEKAGE